MDDDKSIGIVITVIFVTVFIMGLLCGFAILDRVYTSNLCEEICTNTSEYIQCKGGTQNNALIKVRRLRDGSI